MILQKQNEPKEKAASERERVSREQKKTSFQNDNQCSQVIKDKPENTKELTEIENVEIKNEVFDIKFGRRSQGNLIEHGIRRQRHGKQKRNETQRAIEEVHNAKAVPKSSIKRNKRREKVLKRNP